MKIIDRYIIKQFIMPFIYCSLAFFILYLIADLFEHMDEFLRAHTPWYHILKYYLYMLPMIFIQTSPFSLVLALIYELGNFARHFEVVGMKACGISPKRIALPFLGLGFLLSVILLYLHEGVLPKSFVRLDQFKKMYFEKGESKNAKSYRDLAYSNAKENYVFYIHELDLKKNIAKDAQVHYLTPNGSIEKLFRAKEAQWLDKQWWFLDGSILRYDKTGEIEDTPEQFGKMVMRMGESPEDLIREEKANEQMNYLEFRFSLSKKYGKKIPAYEKVELNSKLSMPWICLVLVLVVVPMGINISKRGAFAALGRTLILTIAYYVIQFMGLASGKQDYLDPIFASWCANIIFGGLGGFLMMRLK